MQDQDIETQIRDTFPQLGAWSDLLNEGFTPQPGTPLAQDESVFPDLSTTDIAWQGLGSGVDHLKGFGAWLEAQAGAPPTFHQSATFSVLRGALVGGAIASWVLASDDVHVRTGRSLLVAADWYRNHLNWLTAVGPHANDRALHDARVDYVQQRADQVTALRASRGLKEDVKTTKVVKAAVAEIWPGDAARAAQVLSVWQAGSGDAHALGWQMLTRQYEITPIGGGRFRVGQPSLRDVSDAYFCAYDFVAYGFHRLIELGT